MDIVLLPLLQVLGIAINLFIWALILSAILSWLVHFGVVNTRNNVVQTIGTILEKLTEPVLRPIRSLLPAMGGLDLSPMVLILGLYFIENVLNRLALRYLGGGF